MNNKIDFIRIDKIDLGSLKLKWKSMGINCRFVILHCNLFTIIRIYQRGSLPLQAGNQPILFIEHTCYTQVNIYN